MSTQPTARHRRSDPGRAAPPARRRGTSATRLSTTVLAVRDRGLLPAADLVADRLRHEIQRRPVRPATASGSARTSTSPTTSTKVFRHSDGIFGRWLLNSLLYAGGGALVATLFAAMAGYALAKYPFKGREAVFGSDPRGGAHPRAAARPPAVSARLATGLVNTYWSVLIPSVVSPSGSTSPRVYAEASMPDELTDAARVDGAGELRIFFTIALRLMSPALVTICLFQFVGIWNNFFLPLMSTPTFTLAAHPGSLLLEQPASGPALVRHHRHGLPGVGGAPLYRLPRPPAVLALGAVRRKPQELTRGPFRADQLWRVLRASLTR